MFLGEKSGRPKLFKPFVAFKAALKKLLTL
jgi:hypothetical protein